MSSLAAAHHTGTLGVDDFMATALYDPDGGYYMRADDIGGMRRDFSTIPSLSPLLGRAVARWALALAGRGPLDIIEVGAGGGHLAAAILAGAGWWARRSLRYHIVEVSPRLRVAQQNLLKGRKVTWHDSVAAAVAGCTNPVVISNELVDAFPCRLLRYEGDEWVELRVAWPPSAEDPLRPLAITDPDLDRFSALQPKNWDGGVIPTGQVVEIHPSYREWLTAWASGLNGLNHLTIDYGDVLPGLYSGRPNGSLRGYFSHQRLTGGAVFRAPGQVDLTADVNFTDLESWGRGCGMNTVVLTDQAGFLETWLPARAKKKAASEWAAITDPDGAGGAFKVLWQAAV